MKTIYKLTDGNWTDNKPTDPDEIVVKTSVPDEVEIRTLNHPVLYTADGWDEDAYADAVKETNRHRAIVYLQSTDFVPIQWRDEEELGVEHTRSVEEYRDILVKRQEAREIIRSLNSEK